MIAKLLALAVALTIPATTTGGFANARVPWTFVFPRDHGAHPAFQTEWWYFTGHLRADDGRRFGYEITFFRYGVRPGDPAPRPGQSRWRGNQVYPVHIALTDEGGGRFVYDERLAREALGMGAAATGRVDVRADGWTLQGDAPFRLRAGDGAIGFDLAQHSRKPPAIHGRDGVSVKASCATCASHYYSLTRLATSGTIRYAGRRLHVTGSSWMDHEFGSSELQTDQAGWDWYALQLDDGREIMLYRLRRKDGSLTPESSGSLIERDGRVRALPRDAVRIDAAATWRSPHTGAVYPSGWRITIPGRALDLRLQPTVPDQELANTSGGISYWEGAVTIVDATGRRAGDGYVELTGYAGALAL